MTLWLVDKSALVRLGHSPDADEWDGRSGRGVVTHPRATRVRVGFPAGPAADHRRAGRLPPIAAMPVEYLTPAIEDRAVEVQALLAARGQHRAPSIPDLLVAATAELTGRTVLHLDKDFDLLAQVTGQPLQRIET